MIREKTMDNERFVFLIGIIYPLGELSIMGIYTDTRMLIEAYDKLVNEDARCTEENNLELPQIYKIPLNRFLGEKVEWAKIDGKSYFYEEENIETVSIEETRSCVKIAEFYGINVYCDLDFVKGAYIDLEYTGGEEGDYCWIQMSIEDGSHNATNRYLRATLKEWYEDNKKYLMEIYQTRKIVDIPEW